MKRRNILLALLCMFIWCGMQGQSFKLQTTTGVPLSWGDTIVVQGTTNDFQLTSSVGVTNISGSLKTVMVKRTLLSMVAGTQNAFAWGTLMYPPAVNVSVYGWDITAGGTDSSFFTWYFINNLPGVSYVQYAYYDDNNPADSAWIVFEFNVAQATGMEGNNSLPPTMLFPNPSDGIFHVHNTSSACELKIYDAAGRIIKHEWINDTSENISLDLSNQPKGIYFLKIFDNAGSICAKGKLLLR